MVNDSVSIDYLFPYFELIVELFLLQDHDLFCFRFTLYTKIWNWGLLYPISTKFLLQYSNFVTFHPLRLLITKQTRKEGEDGKAEGKIEI